MMDDTGKKKFDVTLDEKHVYRVDGKRKKSVSGYLNLIDKSNALVPWASRITVEYLAKHTEELKDCTPEKVKEILRNAKAEAKRVKDEAGAIGTEVHKVVEHYFKGEITEIQIQERPEAVQKCYGAFLSWAGEHRLEMLESETIVYNDLLDYCGRLDWIGNVDGKLKLIDFKTGNGIYVQSKFQASAYVKAWERTRKWKGQEEKSIEGAIILRFGKENGIYELHEMSRADLIKAFKGFSALVTLNEQINIANRKKRK